ncbi:MAG: DUF4185 domain-containing protein [Spirochaetes bacterium]|nr:DUF4185 domain-containing protein [Spirochaetota bacterium]
MKERNPSTYLAAQSLILLILISIFLSCDRPEKIRNMGIFGESRKMSVLGQDGCTPISLGDTMMWTFGDTILGSWKGDLSVNSTFEDTAVMKGMISNSLAFSPVPDDQTVASLEFTFYKEKERVAQFIKPFPGEDPQVWRFWAIDGIQLDSTVYVYYIIVYINKNITGSEGNLMPIRVMGVGLAEWRKPPSWKAGDPVGFRRTVKLFSGGDPVFGDSVIRIGDSLYLIGHGPASGGRVPAYIAKVPASSIKIRAAYEFLDARGAWSRNLHDAHPFIDDVMGELSLSYNEFLKRYVVIYCSLDGTIKMVCFKDFRQLKNARPRVVYTPASLPQIASRPNMFYYSGKEIFHTGDAIYAIYIHPAIYQPILLKIPYGAILQKCD